MANVNWAAKALRQAMVEQGLTYRDLGEMAGMNYAVVWSRLNGKKTLTERVAKILADALQVELDIVAEPDPMITVRMPSRFIEWLQTRAADMGCDVETVVVDAVAKWIQQDVSRVKCQSHHNAALIRALRADARIKEKQD